MCFTSTPRTTPFTTSNCNRPWRPTARCTLCRYIQNSNGNRINLYYNDDPTGTPPADPNLQADLTGPPLTLSVIEDSSGRALLLNYKSIFDAYRIVQITGYDDTASKVGDLLGLEIDYGYDQWGNLTSVVRVDAASGAVLRKETYTYSPGDDVTGHNLLTYTEPNGFDAGGNPVTNVADFTTTYTYYGLDPSGNPIPGDGFNQADNYTGGYSLQVPGFNPFFGVPLFEMVESVSQPGGATDSTDPFSVINITYNLSTSLNTPNTRVVTNPNPAIPPTTYTMDSYGATTEISAPDGQGNLGSNNTFMTWADPASPDPAAFSAVDGALTPNELMGIDVEMVSKTDALGRTTSCIYDVNGNVVQQTISFAGMSSGYLPVTQADGTSPVANNKIITSYTYDPIFNVITSETDADGHTSFNIYDSIYESLNPLANLPGGAAVPFTGYNTGNLLANIDAVGDTTAYKYAPPAIVGAYNGTYGPGDLMSVTDPRGNRTQYLQYDAYGNPTVMVDALLNYTTQTFDARSRMIAQTIFGGQSSAHSTTVYVYDGLDRVIRQAQIDDLVTADNKFSLPQDSLAPLPAPYAGQNWALESITQYLPGGQVTETINGLGLVTSYQYDNSDRLSQQTVTNFGLAPNVPVPVPTQYVTTYAYDQNDNLVRETDPRAIITVYRYDDLFHLVETDVEPLPGIDDPVGINQKEVTTAAFDVLGNELSSTDIHGNATNFQYDGLYRLLITQLPVPGPSGQPAEIKTAYDPVGNMVLHTDASGHATTLAYDEANRLSLQTDPMGNRIAYQYDPDGNLILETHSSPMAGGSYQTTYIVAYFFDALNRPTETDEYVVLGDPTVLLPRRRTPSLLR